MKVCGEEFGNSNRVSRGGSWNYDARTCSASNRDNNNPDNRNDNLGFRLAARSIVIYRRFTIPAAFLSDMVGEMNEAGFRW